MKQVLKTAAGVLLGIVGAYCLYAVFQMWEMRKLAEQLAEEQRLETVKEQARAAEQKARMSKGANDIASFSLLPDQVIERCGPPLREIRHKYSEHTHTALYYLGADGQTILFDFDCYHDAVCTKKMERVNRSEYQYMHPTDYESFFAIDNGETEAKYHAPSPENEVKELPCVAGIVPDR